MVPQLPPEVIIVIVGHCQPPFHSLVSARIRRERQDLFRRFSNVGRDWRALMKAEEEALPYLDVTIGKDGISKFGGRKPKQLSITAAETNSRFIELDADLRTDLTMDLLREVSGDLEEVNLTYADDKVLTYLGQLKSLHSLHFQVWKVLETEFNFNLLMAAFQNLRHVSLLNQQAVTLFSVNFPPEMCPLLDSFSIKGAVDLVFGLIAWAPRVVSLLLWDTTDSKGDSGIELFQVVSMLFTVLTNLQNLAYHGPVHVGKILRDLSVAIAYVFVHLQTFTRLRTFPGLPEGQNMAYFVCPSPRPYEATLDQSAYEWSEEHNVELIELLQHYQSGSSSDRSIDTARDIESLGLAGKEVQTAKEKSRREAKVREARELVAADDWFESWEEVRNQGFEFEQICEEHFYGTE